MSADWIFKIVVMGSAGVGKTSFVKGQIEHHDWHDISPSHCIGVDFEIFNCTLGKGDEEADRCKLILWDLKSRHAFLELYRYYLNGACGALLCFDVSNRQSFEDLPIWINYVRSNLGYVPIMIVGLKSDLPFEVSADEIENIVNTYDVDGVFYTSYHIRFKKDVIMKELAKKVIYQHRIPSEETNDAEGDKEVSMALKRKKLKLINHFDNVRKSLHLDDSETHEALRNILRREDQNRCEELKDLPPEEKDAYMVFIQFFSICPICGAHNHEKYLKRFFLSRDPVSNSLRKQLFALMDDSQEFEEIYYNEIELGIPCCDPSKKIFND